MLLLWLALPATASPCVLNDTSRIVEGSHQVLHDFDRPVPGCSPIFGPSGIVYHPKLDRLVVASDKGQLAFMKTDGSDVRCIDLPGDNEGVTWVDADDGTVWVALENGGEPGVAFLRQVDLQTGAVVATRRVAFEGGVVANQGLEAITFVPSSEASDRGTFALGDQTANELRTGCAVPLSRSEASDAPTHCAVTVRPGWQEVSGLDFVRDATMGGVTGVVLASSDRDDLMRAYAPDGRPLGWEIPLPASSSPGQEGHAIKGCTLFVAADDNDQSRKVHRFELAPTGTTPEAAPADGAGPPP